MRQYELTYLISDNVPESDLNKVTGKVGGYVKDAGGNLLKEEIWGRRKLSYPIQKLEFATYVTINFELPADKAKEFEHNIQMTSKIVRHLMIVKDHGTEELTLTEEDIAEAAEIEEVVGGEKSFEAVEGETKESKDLMSVRGGATQISNTDLTQIAQEQSEEKEETEEEAPVVEEKPAEESPVVEEKPAEESPAIEEKVAEETPEEEMEKPKKPVKKVAEAETTEVTKEKKEKAAPAKKTKKDDGEADRLSKLDKELDDILGEDL